MIKPVYTYSAAVARVIDGDTVDLAISVGFHITTTLRCRLARINTAELRDPRAEVGEMAREAKERLIALLAENLGSVTIRSSKPYSEDRYGRWLVEIYVGGSDKSVNQILLNEGLAKLYPEKY